MLRNVQLALAEVADARITPDGFYRGKKVIEKPADDGQE